MAETDENRKLQMITRLLEKGGTMLASHHECGSPLFRYQGKVLCPVCDFQEKNQERKIRPEKRSEKEPGMAEKTVEREGIRREVIPVMEPQPAELSQVAALTQSKIHGIAESLENETDLQRVREKLECIELGIKILKLLGS
ncbi:Sjogren's syndrome/scleroderma autoantigen 1 family protein [Candidatus Methanoperedens nitratireducens]|uniref:Sjogrens syndrome scleroderma autoantigen 1 n=1 Tax=Candidatus Methanoperedens nitratireducens TaxID=1392998 RepID=A0A284VIW1_9EURY|nr:autoantigen p27 domain-containing protein [Candidatus Methanoperedens nitroreducens]SNQ59204.1 Sjogrens syndrome scleroderma autoantigen 1 [Candidatus Methanoperedens nitroreducens]